MIDISNCISGERLQEASDMILVTTKKLKMDSNARKFMIKSVNIDLLQNDQTLVNNPHRIFVYTDILSSESQSQLYKYIRRFSNQFILILHNSDHGLSMDSYIQLRSVNNLKHVYSQNVLFDTKDTEVTPVPIGFANSQWPHGNPQIHQHVFNTSDTKSNFIYLNFNINTNKPKRQLCKDIMEGKGIPWIRNMNYAYFLQLLKSYKFAICPEGNGLDTHRFWECIYLKVIPITLKNPLTKYFSELFPVVLLDKWEDLDYSQLDYDTIINKYPRNYIKQATMEFIISSFNNYIQ